MWAGGRTPPPPPVYMLKEALVLHACHPGYHFSTWILCLIRIFVRRAVGQQIPTQQHSPAAPLTWHSMSGRQNRHEHKPTRPGERNQNK